MILKDIKVRLLCLIILVAFSCTSQMDEIDMNTQKYAKKIFKYIELNDLISIKELNSQNHINLNVFDPEVGICVLTRAIKKGHYSILEYFLKNAVSPNQDTKNVNYMAIHTVSELGDEKGLDLLLKYGANVNIQSHIKYDDGDYGLIKASKSGHLNIVKKLIANGAKVNSVNNNQENSLHGCQNIGVIKFLIKNGIDVNQINSDGYRALDLIGSMAGAFYLLKSGAYHGKYGGNDLADKIRLIIFEKLISIAVGSDNVSLLPKLKNFYSKISEYNNQEQISLFEDSLKGPDRSYYNSLVKKSYEKIEAKVSPNFDMLIRIHEDLLKHKGRPIHE